MKKFFSAILLMTMMVFSVGTFVSCNDLVEEVETIKGQTSDIESTIKGLETQIAALETALAKAQSTADAALKAGDEAKAAAEQAKADAIAEAKAECEVLKAAFEKALEGKADVKALEDLATLVNAEIAGIDSKLATISTAVEQLVATDTELKVQIAALEAYKAYADTAFVTVEEAQKEAQAIRDELTKLAEENYNQLYELIGTNTGVIATLVEEVDELKLGLAGYMETTDANIDEITGYLNSAIEDVDLLKGNVEELQAGLEEVETKVATLEEKVEKIDTDLKTFTTVLKGLVSQIQSVVWVPGYDYTDTDGDGKNDTAELKTNITVDRYTWKSSNSQLRFLATYEISPKSLVSKFSNDAVKVYFSNDIATKAAEPQTYPAEIVSVDANTGRIVVRGRITDRESEVFKFFTYQDSEVLDLVVALHIEENVTGTVDGENVNAGTSVTADYVPVSTTAKVHELTELFYLFDTEVNNKKPAGVDEDGLYEKTIYVPYTTAPANSTRNLFPIDVRMKIEGKYLTLAEAGKYFGVTYTAKYENISDPVYTTLTQNAADDRANFTLTDGKKVTAKAALAKAASQYDLNKAVTVTIGKISVNDETLDYTVQSTYKISYGTTTDIVFEDHSAKWDYRYYVDTNEDPEDPSYANLYNEEYPYAYSPVIDDPWGAYYDYYVTAFDYPEMDVKSSPIDITKYEYVTPTGNTRDFTFSGPSQIKAYDADGNEIKNLVTSEHKIVITALTAKIGRLTSVNLPFCDEPVTFKAKRLLDPNVDNKMQYTASVNITLGAMPEKKVIDLGTFNIPGSQSHSNRFYIGAVAAAIAKDAEYFQTLPQLNYWNPATATPWNQWNRIANECKTTTGLTMTTPGFAADPYSYSYYESTALIIAENDNYGASYNLEEVYEFHGIKYTFKAKVNLVKPEYKLVPNPRLVKNGVVELTGKVTLPTANGETYNGKSDYVLDQIDLRQYVNVEGESVADMINKELIIEYTIKKTRATNAGNTEPLGVYFEDENGDAVVDGNSNYVYTVTGETVIANDANDDGKIDGGKETLTTMILGWDSKDQYDNYNPFETINEATVVFQLKSQDGKVKFGDPVEVKLVVPELVKFETTKTISVPFKNGDALTVANIYNALKVTDLKNDKVINNQSTAAAYKGKLTNETFFDFVYGKTTAPLAANDAYNLYDMDIVPDAANVKIYLKDSNTALKTTDYEFNAATGDVKLAMNTGNLTENVILEIPVYLYHMYQGAHEHMTTVKVEFTK